MSKIQILSLVTLMVLLLPYFTLAQAPRPEEMSPPEIPTQLFSCSPADTLRRCILRLLGDVLRVILVVALAGAALMIAWAGIIYITGLGSRENAKNKIIYAAIGLVIAFLAWVLTVILTNIIGGAAL